MVRRYVNLVDLETTLKNEPGIGIAAVHTEENEPLKIWGDLFNLIQFGPYLPSPRQSFNAHGTQHSEGGRRGGWPTHHPDLGERERARPFSALSEA